jgi:hypothetical protein
MDKDFQIPELLPKHADPDENTGECTHLLD